MKNLLNLILYIFENYPNVEELSKPRLVKIIYLIDWKNSVEFGTQLTEIKWYFNHYGPYVDDVINLIKSREDIFNVSSSNNNYGGVSDKIKLVSNVNIELSEQSKKVADFIIKNTAHRNWTNFIALVYSTYPIKTNSKYTYLDLVADAQKFKASLKEFI